MITITLVRGPDQIRLTRLFWESAQVYAKQMSWYPSGAARNCVAHGIHGPGQTVSQADAVCLAVALEQVVNGAHGDSGDLDLGSIVLIVNFLPAGNRFQHAHQVTMRARAMVIDRHPSASISPKPWQFGLIPLQRRVADLGCTNRSAETIFG
jgi:hypothetical protein